MQNIRRAHREGDSIHAARNSLLHLSPRLLVELSDEDELGFGMLQNVTGRFGSKSWVDLVDEKIKC